MAKGEYESASKVEAANWREHLKHVAHKHAKGESAQLTGTSSLLRRTQHDYDLISEISEI